MLYDLSLIMMPLFEIIISASVISPIFYRLTEAVDDVFSLMLHEILPRRRRNLAHLAKRIHTTGIIGTLTSKPPSRLENGLA